MNDEFHQSKRYLVGFSYKTHFFARAIRWFTKSEFSHSYVVQQGPQGNYVLEATSRGVNLQWYPCFVNDGALGITEFQVDHVQSTMDEAWGKICTNRLNRPYSYMQILGDAFVITMQTLFKVSLPNPFSQRKADVCSELVLGWLRRAKISGFEGLNAGTVSPEDLVLIIRGNKQFTLIDQPPE